MNIYMNEVALSTFSSFDTGNHPSGKSEPERFYHGFVLGLLVELRDKYEVKSNRESGYGRYDIELVPKNSSTPGIIIELKAAKSAQENLQVLAEDALEQIEQKRYDTALLAEGVTDIYKYGIAFYKKNVEIVVK